MKLSIIISVLNSHRIVRYQLRHFLAMRLPGDAELLLMDDGSNPPLTLPRRCIPNIQIHPTHDKRLWTQGLARMAGAKIAQGDYLFFTDIDHVISKAAMDVTMAYTGDFMRFRREFGILSESGKVIQNPATLLRWGLSTRVYRRRKLSAGVHMNTFLIRRSLWFELGQYSLRRASSQKHTMGEDREFNRRLRRAVESGKCKPGEMGPAIYVYPIGRFHETGDVNPHGLFHDSPRDDLGQT